MLLSVAQPLADEVWDSATRGALDPLSFDDRIMPRLERALGSTRRSGAFSRRETRRIRESLSGALMTVAHRLYTGLMMDERPRLALEPAMATIELAGYLTEKIASSIRSMPALVRLRQTAANMLAGLSLLAVSRMERIRFENEAVVGFADRFERALVITLGLKTVAESTGVVAWLAPPASRFELRIQRAIQSAASKLAEHIAHEGKRAPMAETARMLEEYDKFLSRFESYIDISNEDIRASQSKLSGRLLAVEDPQTQESDPVVGAITQNGNISLRLASGREVQVDPELLTGLIPEMQRKQSERQRAGDDTAHTGTKATRKKTTRRKKPG